MTQCHLGRLYITQFHMGRFDVTLWPGPSLCHKYHYTPI